jgi:D-alanyl-D-alanine carboxypeptidase (penicillin-binding protein 5/6)
VALSRARLTSGAHPRTVVNRNVLVRTVRWVRGVKTGHTARAGYVLVGAGRRHGVEIVSAALGDPSEAARDADSRKLLAFGLSRYRLATVLRRGQVLAQARLRYRGAQHVALVARSALQRVLRRGERATVTLDGVPDEVSGPLAEGARVGTALVHARGRVVARVPVVTAQAVAAATLSQRLGDYFSHPLTLALLVGLVGCSLQLLVLRRRATRRRRMRLESRTGSESA